MKKKNWMKDMSDELAVRGIIAVGGSVGVIGALVACFTQSCWNLVLAGLLALVVWVMVTLPDEDGVSLVDIYREAKGEE